MTDLLTPEQLSDLLGGVPERTLKDWRYRGKGPAFVHAGKRVRYRKADVDAWLRKNRTASGQSEAVA